MPTAQQAASGTNARARQHKRDRNDNSRQQQRDDYTPQQHRATLPTTPPRAPRQAPPAIARLLAIDSANVEIPAALTMEALHELPALDAVCRALPPDAHSADKAALVAILATPDREAAAPTPRLGSLIAGIARNLYGTTANPADTSLSQLRPIVTLYRKAVETLRLPSSLLSALEPFPPRGLNSSLDAVRQTALQYLSAEARDVILGIAPHPHDRLARDGVRFPLIDILTPMLAAALSAASSGHRVSVPQARQILMGDDTRIEEIESL